MGRRLRAGDVLALGAGEPCRAASVAAVGEQPWLFDGVLRLLPGLDRSAAAAAAVDALCRRPWRLAPASDRTGYRLEGGAPLPPLGGALVSHPVAMGAVQAPPGGEPVLLMADRQTTGGYAVVGVVAAADFPVAAQLGPGDACRFVPCSWDEAEAAAGARERALDAVVSPEA
jgi:antagonist of KipI